MLKVNFSYLNYIDDKYYYEGKLFTGASFKLRGCLIEEFLKFKDGIQIGNYQSKYLPNDPSLLRVNIDCLEFNGEYLTSYTSYQNQTFSGIGYELDVDDKYCTGEYLIQDGWPGSGIVWDYSGKMRHLGLVLVEFKQYFSWDSNGSLVDFELFSKELHKRMIQVELKENNEIISIWIEKEYFTWIPNFIDKLEFKCFTTEEDLSDCAFSSKLGLYSQGIDDEIFNYFMSKNKLATVSEINILNTSLSDQIILELASLENLKRIILKYHDRDLIGVAQQLKSKRPDCLIKLNSQEIKA
ncbi:MAG TPA: hypothetical protein VK184_02855 [Nostocaceae cyanobacterium]|nr:hypothetical protein [Nostocaceae cyanobacterium]